MVVRRVLALLALAVWQGGFAFHAAVAVPVGMRVLGSHVAQGFVTREVAHWLNRIAVAALCALCWDVWREPDRRRRGALLLAMAGLQAALFVLWPRLDALLDAEARRVLQPAPFALLHRAYLWAHTAQWLCAVAFAALTVCAWSAADAARARAALPASEIGLEGS